MRSYDFIDVYTLKTFLVPLFEIKTRFPATFDCMRRLNFVCTANSTPNPVPTSHFSMSLCRDAFKPVSDTECQESGPWSRKDSALRSMTSRSLICAFLAQS